MLREKDYKRIKHKKYKYQLKLSQKYRLPDYFNLDLDGAIGNGYIKLLPHTDGYTSLYFSSDYSWDGCSGPTWDDKTNMRGGLIHDGLWQLVSEGFLEYPKYAKIANRFFREVLIQDGMWKFRAWYYYWAVNNPVVIRMYAKPKERK